jgi:hypothetical protein
VEEVSSVQRHIDQNEKKLCLHAPTSRVNVHAGDGNQRTPTIIG